MSSSRNSQTKPFRSEKDNITQATPVNDTGGATVRRELHPTRVHTAPRPNIRNSKYTGPPVPMTSKRLQIIRLSHLDKGILVLRINSPNPKPPLSSPPTSKSSSVPDVSGSYLNQPSFDGTSTDPDDYQRFKLQNFVDGVEER